MDTASSVVGLQICAITAGIKKYKSIIKKKRKKYNRIVFLTKTKPNVIKGLISKSLIDSYISHDEFVSVNNVLRKYNEMKEEIKNPENAKKQWKRIVSVIRTILRTKM